MGLKSVVTVAAETALNVVQDLSNSVVVYRHYFSYGSHSTKFDPDTGGAFNLQYTDYQIEKFVILDYSQKEIMAGVAGRDDKKLIFLQTALPITPGLPDEVFIDDIRHVIVDDKTKTGPPINMDPAHATWTIRICKP